MHVLPPLLFSLFLGLFAPSAMPAPQDATAELHGQDERWLQALERELEQIDAQLEKNIALNQEGPLLPWLPARLQDIGEETRACISEAETRLRETNETIEAIGEISATELPALWEKKKELERIRANDQGLLANCRLLNLKAARTLGRMDDFLKSRLADRMLRRSPAFWELALQYLNAPSLLRDLGKGYWDASAAGDTRPMQWVFPALAAAALSGLILGWILQRRLRRWGQRFDESGYYHQLAQSYCSRIPAALSALSIGVAATITGSSLVLLFAFPLAVYWLISPWIRTWLCVPSPAGETEAGAPPLAPATDNACRIGQALRPALALMLLWLTGLVLNVEAQLAEHTVHLLRQIYAVVMGFLLLRIVRLVMELPALETWRYWKPPLSLAVLSGPAAELLGYQRLAQLLFNGFVGSLIALAAVILLGRYLFHRLDALKEGHTRFDRRLKTWLGFEDNAADTARWLKLLIVFTLGPALIATVLYAWNIPQTALDRLVNGFTDGFQVGETTIIPLRVLLAIFGFVLFMMLSRWLRVQISERWLNNARVNRGAREAITNLSVYTLVAVAVLTALNVAGVDLGNIAIVAGALSVGIGFGLQNIVNNFVSGLILLFEQPIRPGDWIIVGDTEGYVKKINIRYTQVQTFDRSDVIVPNSELLSTQVTNWMLRDNFGRVRIPVGVAYGSDVEQVRELLLTLARQHPLVMANDSRVPTPRCLFLNFGDSSLHFELQVFIRDVDYRPSVKSDLLFAINKAFAEAGIEMPFPQRDIHIRSGLHPPNDPDPPPPTPGNLE